MMRRVAAISINRFFSQGTFNRVASSNPEKDILTANLVGKQAQINEAPVKVQDTRKVQDTKKSVREITQEERDKVCAQLEEACRQTSYY